MADKRALIQAGGGIKEIASGDSLDIPSGASYKIGANVAVWADALGCMIGRGNTQSSSGAAIGNNCTATNILANAIGVGSSATGMLSTAIGYYNTASEAGATAIGYSNTASASGAVAMGKGVENGTADTAQFGPSNTAKMTITSAGDAAFGTATDKVAPLGGRAVTVRGGSGGPGNIELASQQADANGVTVGNVVFSDGNLSRADKRSAVIECLVQGATANDRGGSMVFYNKPDGGALVQTMALEHTGTLHVTGNINTESATAPTLLNSWVNYGSGFADAAYWKDKFSVVHLRGTIRSGLTTEGTTLFTLPSGYRPAATVRFPVSDNKTIGAVEVDSSGNVKIIAGSNTRLSLNGIYFRTF